AGVRERGQHTGGLAGVVVGDGEEVAHRLAAEPRQRQAQLVLDQPLADVLLRLELEVAGGVAAQDDRRRLPHRHPEDRQHRRQQLPLPRLAAGEHRHDDRVGDPPDHLRSGDDRPGEESRTQHRQHERRRARAGETSDETKALSDDGASRYGGGRGGHEDTESLSVPDECRDRITHRAEPAGRPRGVYPDAANAQVHTYGDVRVRLRLIVTISLILGTFGGILAWRLVNGDMPWTARADVASEVVVADGEAPPEPVDPAPMAADERRERPAYVTTRDGTSVRSADGSSAVAAAGGVLLPIIGEVDGGYRVFDTCNNEAIVAAHEVEVGTVPADREEGRFDHAVFVIDPGHGVPDYGAVGPNGLTEAEVNLDVAARLVELLRATHDVDWTTGEVRAGDSVPAAAVAVLTRSPEGPNGGQYQLGLTFRARVANALDATALVSIHHNTMPEA